MSRLTEWFKGLSPMVQVVVVVAIVVLLLAAMWFALPLDWLPGFLGS